MKRFLTKILPISLLLSLGLIVSTAHTAHAISLTSFLGFAGLDNFIWVGLSWISYAVMTVASVFLTFTGVLLNASLTLTLHIRDFVTNMESVYVVWTAIRDLSGTFIIFFVLLAAFQIILGLQSPGIGTLLKNIVVAGILINFSFFITGVLIDASNLLSIQIYRQMIPEITTTNETLSFSTKGGIQSIITSSYKQGGIADVFMSAFNLTQLYSNNGQFNKTGQQNALSIRLFVSQTAGAAAMFVAGFSFLFAALAFFFRFGILIFILAFSPIFFAAAIIPQLKTYSKKLVDLFSGQLFFMPVYFILMYLALQVVSTADFTGSGVNLYGADKDYWIALIGMLGNAVFVIILLLIPIFGALSMGGMSTKLAHSWASAIRNKTLGFMGTHTLGRAAAALDKSIGNTRSGNSLIGRDLRKITTGKLANAKMGAKRSFEERQKEQKVVSTKDKELVRAKTFKSLLAGKPPAIDPVTGKPIDLKAVLSQMGEKERLALGAKDLKDKKVVRYLKKAEFDAIKKDDGTNFSPEERREIAEARKTAFADAVTGGDTDTIKDMMKEYEGTDFIGMDKAILVNSNLLPHYTQSQLDKLGKETSDDTKDRIRDAVFAAVGAAPGKPGRIAGVRIPTEGWIRKQVKDGSWK